MGEDVDSDEDSREHPYKITSDHMEKIFQLNVKLLQNKDSEMNPLPMQKEVNSEGFYSIG